MTSTVNGKVTDSNQLYVAERGIKEAGLSEGGKVLDIGCGDGDAVAYLCENCGMKAEGIDMNLAAVEKAKEKHPGIDVKLGDGEFLEDYLSFTFDGVFMKDVLNVINIPDEALHEAFCVLKKGGKLIISDMYYKQPDPNRIKAVKIEADRLAKVPRKLGDCDSPVKRFVDFKFEGVFFEEPLKAELERIGYEVAFFEDITDKVPDSEAVNNVNEARRADTEEAQDTKNKKDDRENTGRFLLIAEKPL